MGAYRQAYSLPEKGMKRKRQPPGYCRECQQTWPADEMSVHTPSCCWRHCPVPAKRIETKQLPRVPGSKL